MAAWSNPVTAMPGDYARHDHAGHGATVPNVDDQHGDERLSFCRICAAACGIVVRVDGDRVLEVRGDLDHPVSRGYTCPKGRALPAFHHDPDRLDHPRV